MRPARKSQGSESSRFPTQAQLYPLFTHTAKIPEGQAPSLKWTLYCQTPAVIILSHPSNLYEDFLIQKQLSALRDKCLCTQSPVFMLVHIFLRLF